MQWASCSISDGRLLQGLVSMLGPWLQVTAIHFDHVLITKAVLKGLDGLLIHCFFRASLESIRSLASSGSKQLHGFYAGCPLTVSFHGLKLAVNTAQDVDPLNFEGSTLPTSDPVLPTTPCVTWALTLFSCV